MKEIDLHCHSEYSHDCSTSVHDLAEKAKELGIGLAVTDHNEIKGSLKLKEFHPDVLLVPGIEVTSKERKDILFYFENFDDLCCFYEKQVAPFKFKDGNSFSSKVDVSYKDLLEQGKHYNSTTVLPHPSMAVKGLKGIIRDEELEFIDGIEVLNACSSKGDNVKSKAWAYKKEKPGTGGSDSHSLDTLGNSTTIVEAENPQSILEEVRKGHIDVTGESVSIRQIAKNTKTIFYNSVGIKK